MTSEAARLSRSPAPVLAAAPPLPLVRSAAAVAPQDARELTTLFLDRLRCLEEGTREYQYARNTLIEMNMSLVWHVAARYRSRSEAREEIGQVGCIGLIKAIDRFDLAREVEFPTYALPCIEGEIKRFFRDSSWSVHVPRSLQERRIALAQAGDALFQSLGRQPTTDELADRLRLTRQEVLAGMVACNGYQAGSLDARLPDDSDEGEHGMVRHLGRLDPGMEFIENVESLKPLIAALTPRERRILRLRFGDERTQSEIGEALGVSQMQISRLLTQILERLRAGLLAED
jgi:RNA polymerase sigma-B factor